MEPDEITLTPQEQVAKDTYDMIWPLLTEQFGDKQDKWGYVDWTGRQERFATKLLETVTQKLLDIQKENDSNE